MADADPNSFDEQPPGDGPGRASVRVHVPVLPRESLEAMGSLSGLTVLDGTEGAGGHSSLFCAEIGATGRLIGLDRDAQILGHALERLWGEPLKGGPRIDLRHASFSEAREVLGTLGLDGCDRVFLDLGVSSLQLDSPERGFSFMRDAELDMRMDPDRDPVSAAEWLRTVREEELERVLREWGGERFAGRIARAIVSARKRAPILRTSQLSDLVVGATPPRFRHGRRHVATRTFQAVRIAVNDEIGHLRRGLESVWDALRPGGRLVVISFHSLEDGVVKSFLKDQTRDRSRRPIQPTESECAANPRARSARLRFGIKEASE